MNQSLRKVLCCFQRQEKVKGQCFENRAGGWLETVHTKTLSTILKEIKNHRYIFSSFSLDTPSWYCLGVIMVIQQNIIDDDGTIFHSTFHVFSMTTHSVKRASGTMKYNLKLKFKLNDSQ
jgi:hypothetical protein